MSQLGRMGKPMYIILLLNLNVKLIHRQVQLQWQLELQLWKKKSLSKRKRRVTHCNFLLLAESMIFQRVTVYHLYNQFFFVKFCSTLKLILDPPLVTCYIVLFIHCALNTEHCNLSKLNIVIYIYIRKLLFVSTWNEKETIKTKWGKEFKSGTSKICGRQPLTLI